MRPDFSLDSRSCSRRVAGTFCESRTARSPSTIETSCSFSESVTSTGKIHESSCFVVAALRVPFADASKLASWSVCTISSVEVSLCAPIATEFTPFVPISSLKAVAARTDENRLSSSSAATGVVAKAALMPATNAKIEVRPYFFITHLTFQTQKRFSDLQAGNAGIKPIAARHDDTR